MASTTLTFDILARDRASRTFDKIGRTADRAHRTFGILSKGAVLLGGALAGIATVSVFKGFIDEAREAGRVGRLTEQVIKSTGGVANITAGQVAKLSERLSNQTAIDDELVQTGANLILTFKNVRNELGKGNQVFDRATAAALDLSAAGFGSVESASKMLGKALNDPLKGLTALGRAGVTFTDDQKKLITSLVEAGDLLGAQKIILAEVESQVGGAAKATADPLQRLGVVVANLKERLGTALLPVLERVADFFVDRLVPAVERAATWFERSLVPGIKAAAAAFEEGDVTSDGFVGAMERAGVAAKGLADFVKTKFVPPISAAFEDVKGFAEEHLAGIDWKGIAKDWLENAKDAAVGIVDGVSEGIRTGDFGKLGKAIGEFVGNAVRRIPDLTDKFFDLVEKVDWFDVGTRLGKSAFSFAVGFAAAFITTALDPTVWIQLIGDHWVELLGAVIAVAFLPARFVGFISKALAKIPFVGTFLSWLFRQFAEISKGAVGAVGRFLGSVFREFSKGLLGPKGTKVIGDVGAWIALIPQRIREFIPSVTGVASRMVQRLADAIRNGAGRVGSAIGNIIERITRPFRGAAGWLLIRGQQVVGGLVRGVGNMFGTLTGKLSTLVGKITGFFKHAGSWLYNAGRNIIRGLISGIRSMFGAIGSAIQDAANIVTNVWPFSPAKTGPLRDKPPEKAGENIGRLLAKGILKGNMHVASAVRGQAATIAGIAAPGAPSPIPRVPIAAGGSGGGTVVNNFHFPRYVGSRQELIEDIRREIGNRGGNVQKVLGRA